jgi:hypothetical protein
MNSTCDICDFRAWTHHVIILGVETFSCCSCAGCDDEEEEFELEENMTRDEIASDDAGIPCRGEI